MHLQNLQLQYVYDFFDLLGWNLPIIPPKLQATCLLTKGLILRSVNWIKLIYSFSTLIYTLLL